MSLRCTDLNALTGVVASLARANIDQRGNEGGNLPWAQEEKTKSSRRTSEVAEHGPVSKPKLTLFAGTDEDGGRLVDANDADPRLCRHWAEVFASRKDVPAASTLRGDPRATCYCTPPLDDAA